MSILDASPKTSVKLLVGRQYELLDVVRSVIEHRITVVLGPRRIGKTSLVKVALSVLSGNERLEGLRLKARFIPIYVDMWSIIAITRSSRHFFEYLDNIVLRALEEYDKGVAEDYRKHTRMIKESIVKEGGIDAIARVSGRKGIMYRYSSEAARCLDELNTVLAKHGRKAVLAIDEAQELGTLKPFSPTAWLAHIHDNLTQIHVLLSGSYVGLLKRVLHPRQRDPLYGRDINRIRVGKLDPSSLSAILLKGLAERGIQPSSEFSETLMRIVGLLIDAELAQHIPLSSRALHESRDRVQAIWRSLVELHNKARRLSSTTPFKSIPQEILNTMLEYLMQFIILIETPLLHSLLVYYAANLIMEIGFNLNTFSLMLPEERIEQIKPFIDFLANPGAKALAILSLFTLSGSPSLVISLAKKLPNNFTEEDLLRIGLQVLDESYRAVCDEVNRFIESYSKKPEIITTILYSLYTSPRTWSSIAQILTQQGIDKKSVNENLRTLVELGYIAKYKEGVNTYYYITDPLLFYALKEKCIKTKT